MAEKLPMPITDEEARAVGERIAEAAQRVYTACRAKGSYLGEWGGCGAIEDGRVQHAVVDDTFNISGYVATYRAWCHFGDTKLYWYYGWRTSEPLPLPEVEIGAMMAGGLVAQASLRDDREEHDVISVRCNGTIKSGKQAGKPCGKFLGDLAAPYKACCSRCGTWHESPPVKEFRVKMGRPDGYVTNTLMRAFDEETARRRVKSHYKTLDILSIEEWKNAPYPDHFGHEGA